MYILIQMVQKGSPPHLRGKQTITLFSVWFSGITPAPAGKTTRFTVFTLANRDHPRTCGENCLPISALSSGIGSPPHLRGKHDAKSTAVSDNGITPAPAGKTCTLTYTILNRKDHPRTCGENSNMLQLILQPQGSPPHLRGKH